ncbi:TlpA disulfide reductase family protein [Rhodoferax sp. PAMC 29310]|uniref:TlpA disulfide reductase family protein n=1 Tax=Rhodoferax sp. PAMC 29310 TaxID=2822760 RepID=UPI001B323229|nr:TlpA disulfide reductase family protein [Rhodoferax sp. PAMC 29310]
MTEKNRNADVDLVASGRRSWLMGAVAGAAAISGAGVAWWVHSPGEVEPSAEEALWLLDFALPTEGSRLAMASFRGKPLVLNFWATWCPPCVEELPMLSDFYSKNAAKGWQVLGLAVDQATPVNRFLAKAPVSFPVALAGVPGMEIGKLLGNQSGGLPFTVVLGVDGKVAHRKIGQIAPEDLLAWEAET